MGSRGSELELVATHQLAIARLRSRVTCGVGLVAARRTSPSSLRTAFSTSEPPPPNLQSPTTMRSRGLSPVSALLSALLLLLPFTAAVLKDDAYEVDWHMPLIGLALPGSTFFQHPSPETKASLIYTITARAIVAALNPKDGEIVWRHQLLEDPKIAGKLASGDGVVVASIGKDLKTFEAATGKLVWEISLPEEIKDVKVTKDNNAVVLLEDGTVAFLESQTGDVAWKRKTTKEYGTHPNRGNQGVLMVGLYQLTSSFYHAEEESLIQSSSTKALLQPFGSHHWTSSISPKSALLIGASVVQPRASMYQSWTRKKLSSAEMQWLGWTRRRGS